MRYKTGEMVFLKGELESIGAVTIGKLDSSGMYELPLYDMWVSEDSIDHDASEKLNGGFVMLYSKDDRVVLRTDLVEGERVGGFTWFHDTDYGGNRGVVITSVDTADKTYELQSGRWITEEMIDHEETLLLNLKETLGGLFETEPSEPWEGPFEAESVSDDSLSLTIKIKGAKAYREKLEELHSQIEAVEHTIEQLNNMDMTIEVEDD